jgi:hypothetical protein
MRYLPVDASGNSSGFNIGTYPYYSATPTASYPEGISPPVATASIDNGLLSYADPRYHDVEYDDVKNVYENTIVPLLTFCQ